MYFFKNAIFFSLLIAALHAGPDDAELEALLNKNSEGDLDDLFNRTIKELEPLEEAVIKESSRAATKEPEATQRHVGDLNDNLDVVINRIFARNMTTDKPFGNTASQSNSIINQIFNSSTTTTTLKPAPANLEPEYCTLPDGQKGACVPHFMCQPNRTIVADGTHLSDIRKRRSIADQPRSRYKRADGDECTTYSEICCSLQDESGNDITDIPENKGEGCGWRNPNGLDNSTSINGDGIAQYGEFPWMCAIIKIQLLPGTHKIVDLYVGGGSLIHPSVVLTAAHYVISASKIRVRAGVWNAHQPGREPHPYQLREISSVDVHKDFNAGNLYYDVALLYLSAPIVSAPNVGVVCLPPPRERVPSGTKCFATGWGKDKFGRDGQYQVVLKKVEIPVVGRATCQKLLRRTRLGWFFKLHSSFMCAGGEEGKDTCKGDGGSPLSCPIESEEGRYMQSGIVAWGIGCGTPGTPGVYVDVSNMRTWIDEQVTKRGYDTKIYSI